MQVGMIGIGRMGANMGRRLIRGGHECVVHDVSADAVRAIANEGAVGATSVDELVARLSPPRVVWLMVPAAVVDGGNSYYRDDVDRARRLAARGLHYVDCGLMAAYAEGPEHPASRERRQADARRRRRDDAPSPSRVLPVRFRV